ncbi:MAG TPA: hypothetical protein VMV43_05320 [Candidatus Nanopelagicaceae bacterium]|nr:hypothetical protein [Candidatus Nanopelagicaceae bacterium]
MDCVANILDFYNRKSKEMEDDLSNFNKVWLSNLLIRIMKNFNKHKNNDLELQNCLILLVNLFSNNDTPDFYNKKGIDTRELINSDKSLFTETLKSEFLNN